MSWTLCSWAATKEKNTRCWVRGPWWPFWVIIQRNYTVVEEFPQSFSNNYASMSRCTILLPPQTPKNSTLLLFNVLMQVRVNSFIINWRYRSSLRLLCSAVQNWTFKPYQKTEETNLWSVIAMSKSGTEVLKQEFMKPPVTSEPCPRILHLNLVFLFSRTHCILLDVIMKRYVNARQHVKW